MSNDRLVEAVSRLTAERDALRRKEQKMEDEREKAKIKIGQMRDSEKQKRALIERKYNDRLVKLSEELEAEKENRRTLVQTEAKYESKINKIMAKITSLETEKTDLESQILALERSEQKLKESSRELSSLRISNNLLLDEKVKLETENSKLQRLAQEGEDAISARTVSEMRTKKLESDLATNRNENETLRAQLEKTKDEYEAIIARERENFKNTDSNAAKRLRSELAQVKEQLEEKNIELQDLRTDKKETLKSRQTDQESELIRSLTSELADLRGRETALQSELQKVQNDLYSSETTLTAEKDRLEAALNIAKVAKESKETEITSLKNLLEQTSEERDDLLNQFNTARKNELKARNELENSKQIELQSMAGNRMRLEELENENLRLNGSIENVNRKLEELSEKLLISNQSCSEYQNTIGDLERQIVELESKLGHERSDELERLAMLEAEKENLERELESKDRDRIESEKEELKSRTELTQVKAELDLISLQIEEKEDELASLRGKLVETESERDDLLFQLAETQKEQRKGQIDTEGLKSEMDSLRRKYNSEMTQWETRNEKLEDELTEALELLDQLKIEDGKHKEIQSDLAQQLCNKQQEMEDADRRRSLHQTDLQDLVNELETERDLAKNSLLELKQEIDEKSQKIELLEGNLAQLEKFQQETEECFIEEKTRATQFEAALKIREETSDTARKNVIRLESELDRIEDESARKIEQLEQENELVKEQNQDLTKKLKRLKRENNEFKQVEEEIESHIDGKEKRIVELKSQYSCEKRRREEAESDLESQQRLIRTLKSDKLSAAAAYKETNKMRRENDELNGQIIAEREKNNQLKHENSDLKIDQTRSRETMHQQANLIEFLQRQNEELTPKKKRLSKAKPSPRQFQPPPLYRDLERQIDLLRAENAKLKSKLYGSKTDLDKIKVESQSRDSSPVKPPRNIINIDLKNLRKSSGKFTSFPAMYVGLCSVSSLPVYVGDQIIERDGLVAHAKYFDEFQKLLNKAHQKPKSGKNCLKARTDSVHQTGKLLLLYDEKWESCHAEVDGTILTLKNDSLMTEIDLGENVALHGAVLFDQLQYVAQVDHELCFAIESIQSAHHTGEIIEATHLCALSLTDKQSWFECLKSIVDVPKLPKNDNTKFQVEKGHKFSVNSAGQIPEVVTALKIEEMETLLMGTKNALMAVQNGKIIELSKHPVVKLVAYEDVIFAISGKEFNPSFCLLRDVMKAVTNRSTLKFTKISSTSCHVISAGSYQGKIGLAVAFGSTVKIFTLTKNNTLDEHYNLREVLKNELCESPSALAFSTTSVICGTDKIIEIDFIKNCQEPYLAEAEIRKTHQEKPISMFTIYDSGKERHLICGQHGGYLIDNCGRVVQKIIWASLPLAFEFSAPFLFVSHFYGIELVRIGVGQVSQPTVLSSYRPRFLGSINGNLIVLSRPHGEIRTQQAQIKFLTGTAEIEYDEALSGPSSLASDPHYAVSYYRPPKPRQVNYEPESLSSQSSTLVSTYSIY